MNNAFIALLQSLNTKIQTMKEADFKIYDEENPEYFLDKIYYDEKNDKIFFGLKED